MANGKWGGGVPLGNWLASRGFFAVINARKRFMRAKNAVKSARRPHAIIAANGAETARQLRGWIDQGYDKLNLGGGRKQLDGFVTVDFVAGKDGRYVAANILDLAFIPDGSMSHIHTNHVLEHLTTEQIRHQLSEYRRILKPGGLMTIRCPNALGAAYGFWFEPVIESDAAEFVALGFPHDENLANPDDVWCHRDVFAVMHWFYGDVGNIENQHMSILTPTIMRRLVEEAGFEILKMAEPEALNLVIVSRAPAFGTA